MQMQTVGLWGLSATELSHLQAGLPRKLRETLRFTSFPAAAQLMAVEHLALLAVAPGAVPTMDTPLPPCRLLLLPGTERAFLGLLHANCVISYGGSSKDSLTLSALEGGVLCLAIQRTLPTLLGGSVERQELVFPLRGAERPLQLLFRVGLLLTLGCEPEQLSSLLPRCLPPRPSAQRGAARSAPSAPFL